MSTTDPIASYAAQTQASLTAAQTKKSANNLGIDEFLTLMTTQLKNQDPMKPLDGTAFIAQLAQFGAVSGIQEMQTSMETLAASLRSTQALNGATLVGRDVLAPADAINHIEGVSVSGEIEIPEGVSDVEIRITDSTGEVVRRMTVPATGGHTAFTWDGLRDNGANAASGAYDIEAIARVGGGSESLNMLMAGRVASVSIDANGAGLTLNTPTLGAVSMADVRRVM
ncbi:MAG: flagellar hook assembly protein FlgD [Steroidobacter sp.]